MGFKRYTLQGIGILLAVFFLLAGTGFNVQHYCCDYCRAEGIAHLIPTANNAQDSPTLTNQCATAEDNCCYFRHLEVEHTIMPHPLELSPVVSVTLYFVDTNTLFLPFLASAESHWLRSHIQIAEAEIFIIHRSLLL